MLSTIGPTRWASSSMPLSSSVDAVPRPGTSAGSRSLERLINVAVDAGAQSREDAFAEVATTLLAETKRLQVAAWRHNAALHASLVHKVWDGREVLQAKVNNRAASEA